MSISFYRKVRAFTQSSPFLSKFHSLSHDILDISSFVFISRSGNVFEFSDKRCMNGFPYSVTLPWLLSIRVLLGSLLVLHTTFLSRFTTVRIRLIHGRALSASGFYLLVVRCAIWNSFPWEVPLHRLIYFFTGGPTLSPFLRFSLYGIV
jgi:hypothetical protein